MTSPGSVRLSSNTSLRSCVLCVETKCPATTTAYRRAKVARVSEFASPFE